MRCADHALEYRKLADIKPYQKNPRKNDKAVAAVANSIREYGFQSPIIVDKDGVIIAGHTRYKAAKRLRLSTVPVIVAAELTPEQAKELRIADNSTGEVAEWDLPVLSAELAQLTFDPAKFGAMHDGYGINHMFHTDQGDPMYPEYPGYVVFLGASIIGFWYWCTDQHIVQRVLGQQPGEDNAKVIARARRGTIAAGFFKILPCFMFLIPGMIAIALQNKAGSGFDMGVNAAGQLNTDAAFAVMVKNVLPTGVKGIVTIGFVCALVASLAAFFNSCATLFTEDFYKPLKKGMSEAHYVLVGRIATVVVVLLGLAWMPVMMSMDTLYTYLQGIQSLLAPSMVAVFTLGIFSKRITPKAGEWGLIGGFAIGMLRLVTNVVTDSGKAVMDGAFWDSTAWFWQTNWLIFECWLLVFIIGLMIVVSFFTPAPSKEQIEAITFTTDYRKMIRSSWNVWDIVGTLLVIGLCAAFYWYFW